MARDVALEPLLLPLRDRLALAALGALVGCVQGGCSDQSGRPDATPQTKTDPARPAAATKTSCFEPHTSMRTSGTGTPVPRPPPSAFDADGCWPFESVTNDCCNPAVSGPKFVDGECCYTFPTDSTCCGRPFVVEGQAIVAEVVERSDWGALFGTSVTPAELAEEVAARWLADAQLEHASIASFGRFVMDLLALGAPADLLAGAAQALRDEVEHATLCFGIASRTSGRSVGPGSLRASTPDLAPQTAGDIVWGALAEGCIGETVAAALAAARRDVAKDPETRAALVRIAEDEARHAELAYRFLGWALGAHPGAVGPLVERAIAYVEARADVPEPEDHRTHAEPDPDSLHAFGLLPRVEERRLEQLVLAHVVAPALTTLRDSRTSGALTLSSTRPWGETPVHRRA